MTNNLYHEIILDIMRRERQDFWDYTGGKFTHTMPTFLIRKHFNSESVLDMTGIETRKAMLLLCKQGLVRKHPRSRRGQAYWQLTDGEE
ncbi:hypothetical protein EXT67_20855 [Pectobacterium atrosepticum]|uniref:Uncharacterized protein n=1 Tax=Pectobacterium phage phiTE TaxID=1116482 RepID=K9L5J2_9CAUD|nr:hypothetical protein [Pectobacterium atrosepticum]YP_007392478.1 hypothetical protein phiTE_016 [Pectobacterium phage phiTE]AEZ66182.1 hypothetical protein phiTE_016 [Pectobacterium phage phiTE]MCL6318753.1 hypothetical protein [Pectobacterium atrosepticum]